MLDRLVRVVVLCAVCALTLLPVTQESRGTPGKKANAKRTAFFTDYGADAVYAVQAKFKPTKVKAVKVKKTITGNKIDRPYAAAMDPANASYVLVTNEGDDSVAIIDAKKRKVLDTVPVGKEPHGVDITPDGGYAFVANSGDNSISIIDMDAALARVGTGRIVDAVIGTIKVAKAPESVVINDRSKPADRPMEVYVTSVGSSTVSNINATAAIAKALDGQTPKVYEEFEAGCEMNGAIESVPFGSAFSSTMWTCNDGTFGRGPIGRLGRNAGERGSEDEEEEEFEDEEEEDRRTVGTSAFRFLFAFQVPYPNDTSVTAIRSTVPYIDKTFGCNEAAWIYSAGPASGARAEDHETFIWDFFNPEVSLGQGRVLDQVMGTTGTGIYMHPACGENCDLAKIVKARVDVAVKDAVDIRGGAIETVLPKGDACI